jgi:hypothetical protein
MSLAALALAALLALAPTARRSAPAIWAESPTEYTDRLASVADDIAAASSSPHDVALLVGVAVEESGLSPDVDAGFCAVRWGCDGGRALSIWQLHAVSDEQAAVVRWDRRAAAVVALRRIRSALYRCRALPAADRYVGLLGRCYTDLASLATARKVAASVARADAVRERS